MADVPRMTGRLKEMYDTLVAFKKQKRRWPTRAELVFSTTMPYQVGLVMVEALKDLGLVLVIRDSKTKTTGIRHIIELAE